MSLFLLALLVLPVRDTVLRFPLRTAEIGASSVGDPLSGIWAHVIPVPARPSGFAHDVASAPNAKWFAVGSFGEQGDSLVYGVVLDSTKRTLTILIAQEGPSTLTATRAITLQRPGSESALTVSPRIMVGQGADRRGVRFSVDERGRLQWRPDDRWETLLRQGNGVLSVRLIPFEPGSWVTFIDHDNDGAHDQHLTPTQVVALGGYYWTWAVDAPRREIVLTRSAREPVIAGYRAPVAMARRDSASPETPLVTEGVPTLLIFCYVGCEGCKLALPAIDSLLGQAGPGLDRQVVIVAKGSPDRHAYQSTLGTRMRVVLGEEAWDRFAVMPTPTFVATDRSGMIVWRDEGWSEDARQRVAAFLGTR